MSQTDLEADLRILKELARKFPDEPWISMNVAWVNGGSRVGVSNSPEGAMVFFNSAEEHVSSLAEAEALLRRIFADEIVCVTGYYREQFSFCRLAPADAITDGLPKPEQAHLDQTQRSDHLVVETWMRGMLAEDE